MFLNHIQQMMQGSQANLLGGGGFGMEPPAVHQTVDEIESKMQYSGRTRSRFSFANTNSEEEPISNLAPPPGFNNFIN